MQSACTTPSRGPACNWRRAAPGRAPTASSYLSNWWSPISGRLTAVAVILIVLGFAAWTHFVSLDLVEFKQDEAEALNNAARMVSTGVIPLSAPASSTGIVNSPVITWLLGVPTLLGWDAAGATGFIALFTVLAAGISCAVAWRAAGPVAGLTAGIIVGTAFWTTIHTRKAWDVGMVPFFAALFLLAAQDWLGKRRPWSLVWAALCLAFMIQFHISSIPHTLVLAVAAGLAAWWQQLRPLPLVTAGLVFVGAFATVIWYQLSNGLPILSTAGGLAGGDARIDGTAAWLALSALGDSNYQVLFGPGGTAHLLSIGWLVVLVALLALAALVLPWADRRGAADGRAVLRRTVVVAAVSAVIPILFYTRYTHPLQLHYFLQVVPALAVLAGIGMARVIALVPGRPGHWAAGAGVALVLAYAVVQTSVLQGVLQRVSTDYAEGGYAVPYRFYRDAFDRVLERVGGPETPVIINGRADRHQVYGYFARGRWQPVFMELVEAVPVPAGGSVPIYVNDETAGPARELLTAVAGANAIESPLPGGRSIQVARVPAADMPAGSDTPLITYPNGVVVSGASLPATVVAGTSVWARVDWTVREVVPGEHRMSLQLVEDRGGVASQTDGIGWPVARWQPGDRVTSWFRVDIPTTVNQGPASYAFTMYQLGQPGRANPDTRLPSANNTVRLGSATVRPGPAVISRLTPLAVTFETSIRLLGFSLRRLETGVEVILAWETTQPVRDDLTVFVHAVGPSGLISQSDSPPAGGNLPTSRWEAGDMVLDRHLLDSVAGADRILVGLYRNPGAVRLSTSDGGDTVQLPATIP